MDLTELPPAFRALIESYPDSKVTEAHARRLFSSQLPSPAPSTAAEWEEFVLSQDFFCREYGDVDDDDDDEDEEIPIRVYLSGRVQRVVEETFSGYYNIEAPRRLLDDFAALLDYVRDEGVTHYSDLLGLDTEITSSDEEMLFMDVDDADMR